MGQSDPYVVLRVAGQPLKRCKTVKQTLNPEWDEKIDFEGVLEQLVALMSDEAATAPDIRAIRGAGSCTLRAPRLWRSSAASPTASSSGGKCISPRETALGPEPTEAKNTGAPRSEACWSCKASRPCADCVPLTRGSAGQ